MYEDKVIKGESVTLHIPGVEEWTLKELRFTCKKNKVKNYKKMSREQLIKEVKAILIKVSKR